MAIADRLGVLNQGSLVQLGTPLELWEKPKNSFVYDFLGSYNTFIGFETESGQLVLSLKPPIPAKGKVVKAFSRPHELLLERKPQEEKFYMRAGVLHINRAGPLVKVELEGLPSERFYQADIEKSAFESLDIKIGERLWIRPSSYRSFEE